ncbi:glycosyltransferase family 87 protein [Streptomyces sp. NPDC093225]|uniref:glycosyltransferase family 87 protein n=1 Tax=Streptomyces sp. NPDC093225 TaxID=3366034 RepID=UPI003825D292
MRWEKRGEGAFGAWLLRPAPPIWQLAAAGVLVAVAVSVSVRTADGGMDNAIVVRAADALLDGRSPYADKRFLYFPSAVLMAVPEALVPVGVQRVLVPPGTSALLAVGWWAALRIFSVPLRSRFGVLGLAVLAAAYQPYANLVLLGNWTCLSAAALPLALLAAHRGRWVRAGLIVGAAVAAKPMLVPVGLLFVFARRWRGLAAVVLVPLGASLLGAALMPRPSLFFTGTLPFLLRGQDSFALPWDASPVAVLPRLGVPQPAAVAVAGLLAAAGLGCAWRRWRRADEGPQRLVETACMVMLAAFLVSRPSFDHYLLVVLPLLLASGVRDGSMPRSPWFWLALVPQTAGIPWPSEFENKKRAFRDMATLCSLAGLLAGRALRGRRVTLEPVTTAGSPPRTEPECAATPVPSASRTAF